MGVYLFVNPHLDDGVFSWGATMSRLAQQGHQVVSVTVFAGEPEADRIPPKGHAWNAKIGLDSIEPRRVEDASALTVLSPRIAAVHLDYLDVVYRWNGNVPRVIDGADKYGEPGKADEALRVDLTNTFIDLLAKYEPDAVFSVAGIARHTDHKLVSYAIREAAAIHAHEGSAVPLYLAEDLPYALDQGSVTLEEVFPGGQIEVARVPGSVHARKIAAMHEYGSQLSLFAPYMTRPWTEVFQDHASQAAADGSFGERYVAYAVAERALPSVNTLMSGLTLS